MKILLYEQSDEIINFFVMQMGSIFGSIYLFSYFLTGSYSYFIFHSSQNKTIDIGLPFNEF